MEYVAEGETEEFMNKEVIFSCFAFFLYGVMEAPSRP
jgi:hypothetical protein